MPVKLSFPRLRAIAGWFSRVDYELFAGIFGHQAAASVAGSAVEIGVHHGKSFAAIGCLSGDARLYAIDLFDQQEKNTDNSGKGDKARFLETLDRFGIDRGRVVIDSRFSSDVRSADIVGSVGPASFFHIDGGHHAEAVENDLRLAVESLAPGGVIAVDDMFRAEWPEVSAAVFGSDALIAHGIGCFAIGFNKAYFCARAHARGYQRALLESEFLRAHLSKVYDGAEGPILVFSRQALPEWKPHIVLGWLASVYFPSAYVLARRWLPWESRSVREGLDRHFPKVAA